MGGVHEMIIHGVGKVVGGDAVRLQQHVVDVIFGDGQLALYQVIELKLILDGAGRTETQHPGIALIQLLPDVFHGTVTPHGVFSVIAGGFLGSFLLLSNGGKLLLGAEAGISLSFGYKLLGENMVDGGSLALAVGSVKTAVAGVGGAFVKADAVVGQGVNQHFNGAGDFSLGVGIFHAQEQHAAALVGHPLGNHALNQVAKVDKTGGGGGHTGNNGSFGKTTGRESGFQVLGGIGYLGKKQIGKELIIHDRYLVIKKFFIYYIII